jgi:5'-nucleotidase
MEKLILISNDDGIYAPGIKALYEVASSFGAVSVVAPASEQSAVGHAITISDPIKIKKIERNSIFSGFAVTGTPADCVKLAVKVLLEKKPDMVISGINLGPNTGISVIYSGTVSAATEGTILGIPSIAISLGSFTSPEWETAKYAAKLIIEKAVKYGLPADVLLNVNVPNISIAELKGIKITRMGSSRFEEIFHQRSNPAGDIYYWLDGELKIIGDSSGTDIEALHDGYISITPISYDLTNYSAIATIQERFLKN